MQNEKRWQEREKERSGTDNKKKLSNWCLNKKNTTTDEVAGTALNTNIDTKYWLQTDLFSLRSRGDCVFSLSGSLSPQFLCGNRIMRPLCRIMDAVKCLLKSVPIAIIEWNDQIVEIVTGMFRQILIFEWNKGFALRSRMRCSRYVWKRTELLGR